VKAAVDAKVAQILEKKELKRDKAKMVMDDSSDEEFLERLDNLEEFKSWSTQKMTSMETMLKALYDEKFPAKQMQHNKDRRGSWSSSSGDSKSSSYEYITVDTNTKKCSENSPAPTPSSTPVSVSSSITGLI
jgi:hypothetical protein